MIKGISFGNIDAIAKAKIQNRNLNSEFKTKGQLLDDFERNKKINLYDIGEDTVNILCRPAPWLIDDVEVYKTENPSEIKMKSKLSLRHDGITLKTTPSEQMILESCDKSNSHIMSAWIVARRLQEKG